MALGRKLYVPYNGMVFLIMEWRGVGERMKSPLVQRKSQGKIPCRKTEFCTVSNKVVNEKVI